MSHNLTLCLLQHQRILNTVTQSCTVAVTTTGGLDTIVHSYFVTVTTPEDTGHHHTILHLDWYNIRAQSSLALTLLAFEILVRSIGEVCDRLGRTFLMSLVGNHWSTGGLQVNTSLVKEGLIIFPLFLLEGNAILPMTPKADCEKILNTITQYYTVRVTTTEDTVHYHTILHCEGDNTRGY